MVIVVAAQTLLETLLLSDFGRLRPDRARHVASLHDKCATQQPVQETNEPRSNESVSLRSTPPRSKAT